MSYGEVYGASSDVSSSLWAEGLRSRDRIALLTHLTPEAIQSYMGIARLGAIAVPLDPKSSSYELKQLLDHASVDALLSTNDVLSPHEAVFSHLSARRVELSVGQLLVMPSVERESRAAGDRDMTSHDEIAVILFTSGTSGTPKGVLLSYENLYRAACAVCAVFGLGPKDRVLCCLPLHTIFGLSSIVGPTLLAGGTIALEPHFSPRTVLESIDRWELTAMLGVPTMYDMIRAYRGDDDFDVSTLRFCYSAGASLAPTTQRRWEAAFGVPLVNGYGQTEAPVTCFERLHDRRIGSIGKPAPDTDIRVMDEDGGELRAGRSGELAVRGPTVMRGYLDDPASFSEQLRPGGWLLTGDIGRIDDDGFCYVVGRKKDIIIRGGANIAPAEVEDVLCRHKDVAQAVVLGVRDEIYGERVKACIVPKVGEVIQAQELQDFCRQYLSEHKVPEVIRFLEALPLNRAGKVIKSAL